MAPSPWVTNGVAAIVACVWSASLILGYARQDWTPLTVTTPVMLVLAGYAFGVRLIRGASNGNGNGRDSKEKQK